MSAPIGWWIFHVLATVGILCAVAFLWWLYNEPRCFVGKRGCAQCAVCAEGGPQGALCGVCGGSWCSTHPAGEK